MQDERNDSDILIRIAELSRAIVLRIEPQRREVWCSETTHIILDQPASRVAASFVGTDDLIHEDDRERIAHAIAQASAVPHEMDIRMRKGSDDLAVLKATVAIAEQTTPESVLILLQDKTAQSYDQRSQAIHNLLSDEAHFRHCVATETTCFDDGLKRVFGIDLEGTHRFPHSFLDHIHPDDRDTALRSFLSMLDAGDAFGELHYRLRRGDGSYAMARERIHVERAANGLAETVYSSVTDITMWHEESKRRELLGRVSGRVVIDYDPQTDDLRVSGAFEERLGHRAEELPTCIADYLELLHPDDRPTLQTALKELREGEVWTTPRELNYRLRRADGSFGHFLDRSLTVTDDLGRARAVLASLTDVSNLLQTQEALRYSHSRLKAIAEISGQTIAELIFPENKVFWSGAIKEQFGYLPEELPTDPIGAFALLHPDDRAEHLDLLAKLARGELWTEPLEIICRGRHKDGRMQRILHRSVCTLDEKGQLKSVLVFMTNVTALTLKQDQLLAMSEIASDAAYEYRHDEGRVTFNQGFSTFFGLDIVGEHSLPFQWGDFVHPDDSERLEAAFAAFIFGDQQRFTCEYRLRRGDGTWAVVTQKSAALRDEDGQATLIIGTLDDITQQRRTEARLRDAIEALDSGFALYDEKQQLVMHNRQFVDLNSAIEDVIKPGVTRDALLNAKATRNLLLAPDKAPYSEYRGEQRPINTIITHADGRLQDIRLNPTEAGDWVSLVTDVTDVIQDQKKLRAMFDVSADAMFEYDVVNNKITFDRGFSTQFGYDWSDTYTLPSPWEAAVHPEDYHRVFTARNEFIASRRARFDVEFRMQRADGSWAYVAERAVALRDDRGGAVLIIGAVADLTEQRMMEDKLHVAQKMEAIGRIAGGIAHDFNNLLAVIMGNAELLAMLSETAGQKQSVEEIVDATRRGAELTRRLLSFARRSRLTPELINPNELVSGMGKLIARVMPAMIRVETSLQAGLWSTRVDPSFLESALLNLVINARDAMPKGGTLTIETANRRVTEDYAIERNEVIAPGRYVMLAVTDTGTGIPRELLERVVEPFFTTKAPNLGSGLGLSMVDGFVRQSGGLLRIYSEPDVGTTITLFLPAAPDGVTKRPASPARSNAKAPATGLRVLLVEDETRVRAVIGRVLQDHGLEVIEAESGDAAMQIFATMEPKPDILLTDVVMPGKVQGPELARRLKELEPKLPIIFMSGYANEAAINGNGLRPDDIFLMKPIQRQTLIDAIARISGPAEDG
ncbi:MAG: PAS domain S-box protein [Rhodobacteraceae bacterium]|nr:MAG: PAS domain S-box protein [Paracoccaceae bacterium]